MLTELEKKIIGRMSGDIPVCERPYAAVADELGLGEEEVLSALKSLTERGVMRRLGATLYHQSAGFDANAMLAMKIAPQRVDAAGELLAGFPEVTHCYHRPPCGDWPYNLYVMVHGADEESCRKAAAVMTEKVKPDDHLLLFSDRELKKTSMEYFPSDEED